MSSGGKFLEASFEVRASILQPWAAATTHMGGGAVTPQAGVVPEEGVARAWPGRLPHRPEQGSPDVWFCQESSCIPATMTKIRSLMAPAFAENEGQMGR